MKRSIAVFALLVTVLAIDACAAHKATPSAGPSATVAATVSMPTTGPVMPHMPSKLVGKTRVFLHVTKAYDPARFPKAAMDGEPSRIHFFKPTHDEGAVNRDYPAYDARTFKFLALPGAAMVFPPQGYYMFVKNGGSANAALKGTGYKATEIRDSGHIKILPNLYLGYYDFAWVSVNVLAEYWSGNESMNQELWREGNDYVIVANSFNGGISLMAAPEIKTVRDLAGQQVGIMNPAFNMEMLLDRKLGTVGLATQSAGGNVGVESGSPGFVMNELLAHKLKAVFAWGSYAQHLKQVGFHELLPWQELGYGQRLPYEVLVVRRDILDKHPDIVQKVVQANYDATKQALTVGDYKSYEYAKAEYYWAHYMGAPQKISSLDLPSRMNIDATPNTVFLHDVWSYMTRYHYFKVPYRYDELVDMRFMNAVRR